MNTLLSRRAFASAAFAPLFVPRAALLTGVALGALASPGTAFAADTKLTALGFGTTPTLFYGEEGGVSKKYSGDSYHNVKDYGAVGNGVADDTAAIQACIDWTASENRGIIFFPQGEYLTSAPLTFNSNAPAIHFLGCGKGSRIIGNFAGFILSRDNANITSGNRTIEKLEIANAHASGGGIDLACSVNAAVRDCNVSAAQAIIMVSPVQVTQSFVIENCLCSSNGLSGSTNGIEVGANGVISGCDINGFDVGIRASGTDGLVVQGCRIEQCNYGVFLGTGFNITTSGQDGFVMLGGTMESCGTALRLASNFLISGVRIQAFSNSAPGGTDPNYGILIVSSGGANGAVIGCDVGGDFVNAAISCGNSANPAKLVFIGTTAASTATNGGVDWELPTTAHTAEWVNCNVLPTFLFAGLPTSSPGRVAGKQYFITDANTATIGNAVTAGGAPNTAGFVVWNGTAWTLMSK